MSYDSLTNQGDYFSSHYLAEILPRDLKAGLLARWTTEEKATGTEEAGRETPRQGLRTLRKRFFNDRARLATDAERHNGAVVSDSSANGILTWRKTLHELHDSILRALGYKDASGQDATSITVTRAGKDYQIPVLHAEPATDPYIVAVECGWATDTDAALDPDGAGRLREPITLNTQETLTTGSQLATFLFACSDPPRYVLLLAGGVVTLADRFAWGEGRYLSVSLDTVLERRDTKTGGELDVIAALFSADGLRTPAEGGEEPIKQLLANSRQHAVGVSTELRNGLQESVELIANEVLARIAGAGVQPRDLGEPQELARTLTRESLRYLYRILFLLYAEARPDLGILPSDHREYGEGYGLTRLGSLIERDLVSEQARTGFHLYESLDLLFRLVNTGHRPRGATTEPDEKASESEGIRFEPLRSDLFEPGAIRLIGRNTLKNPLYDEDEPPADGNGNGNGGQAEFIDTRLRNATLHKVLGLLMLTRAKGGRKGSRGGYISYAQLGINQLGAVYEGLMSYTGFIADEELYEVAKGGDSTGGSWMVPASRIQDYEDGVFVTREDEETGEKSRVRHPAGSFVYRLAGRDRQTSASYYTPESLTSVTVQLALEHRLKEGDGISGARELLDWKICEPALGSGAFLNEAINQVAAKYLELRQAELDEPIPPETFGTELQKVKAYLALHNSYGVDLNATAVELAEVSLWLNVMHPGLQAPWFGLHLRRGNSLIGANRRVYSEESVRKGTWRDEAPTDHPFSAGDIPEGTIHHFLLPASGWGAVAGEKEAKELAPEATKQLADWRKMTRKVPSAKKQRGKKLSQLQRLQALAGRAEYLWELVQARLEISEREISRHIDVWGAEDLPHPTEAVAREKVQADLRAPGTPYWRLKAVMDAWCALWFWPVDAAGLLDGTAEQYERSSELTESLPGRGRRSVVPLADLEDWIDFAEAVLGTADLNDGMIVPRFEKLSDVEEHENQLAVWMGMDSARRVGTRFPWFDTVVEIAEEQGFFHWEVEFAQVFTRGGFDLQMGNPPWVRPEWDEAAVLAELDPWFMLAEKPDLREWRDRKRAVLVEERGLTFTLSELKDQSGAATFLSSLATHNLLVRTRPDLYRAFMVRAWANLGQNGIAGLVHPDTHFGGRNEGRLRTAAYRRLRMHADFMNVSQRFFPIPVSHTSHFGVHIYGPIKDIDFQHLSWLFHTATLIDSLTHDGSGDPPGIKHQGEWDIRPHKARIVRVTRDVLSQWRLLVGDTDTPIEEARILSPVTTHEQDAISALENFSLRLGSRELRISDGYNEKRARVAGLIRWEVSEPDEWSEVILQGPHLGVATPFFKQPSDTGSSDQVQDLTLLSENAIPRTNYQRATDLPTYQRAQIRWVDEQENKPYTDFYRLAWRRMIPANTDRSLFAALIPPGPAHVDAIHSMALGSNRETALVAGLWSSLPVDYLLRITRKGDLRMTEARAMPAPELDHPLAAPLLLRTLRLNCLTDAYASLWEGLYDALWRSDHWAIVWPELSSISEVEPGWNQNIPLRTEMERRAALVELDALVAVWLGLSTEELAAIYPSRFPVLAGYEDATYFDVNGRKIAGHRNAYGHGQAKDDYEQVVAHYNGESSDAPEGYTPPFYKANREEEMRQAHAVFSARLREATGDGPS